MNTVFQEKNTIWRPIIWCVENAVNIIKEENMDLINRIDFCWKAENTDDILVFFKMKLVESDDEVHQLYESFAGYITDLNESLNKKKLSKNILKFSESDASYTDIYFTFLEKTNYKFTIIQSPKKIFVCDLGDVIWDECMAQKHMKELALRHLEQIGKSVTNKEWDERFNEIADRTEGERFTKCISYICNENVARIIKKIIDDDFAKMPDSIYLSLHPVREGVYRTLYEISKRYNMIILANQPQKANVLLIENRIHIICPIMILSYMYKDKKPSLSFFNNVIKKINIPDSTDNNLLNIVMCGNRKDMDLLPASTLGWTTIQFLCSKSIVREDMIKPDFKPDYSIADFAELLQIL